MAQFEVLKDFKDVHTKEVYGAGAVVEMTVKRSKEVAKNLDDTYLKRVDKDEQN